RGLAVSHSLLDAFSSSSRFQLNGPRNSGGMSSADSIPSTQLSPWFFQPKKASSSPCRSRSAGVGKDHILTSPSQLVAAWNIGPGGGVVSVVAVHPADVPERLGLDLVLVRPLDAHGPSSGSAQSTFSANSLTACQ